MPQDKEKQEQGYLVIDPHKCDKCGKIYGKTNANYNGVKIWQACGCHPENLMYFVDENQLTRPEYSEALLGDKK